MDVGSAQCASSNTNNTGACRASCSIRCTRALNVERLCCSVAPAAPLESPKDKVIYHYSQHCHGCKRFGGKYEIFARDAHLIPGVDFYRIDNDRNKAEGVRNYNSTPVFVYYKAGYPQYPFLYRMDIWTEALFGMFLTVTKEVAVVPPSVLEKCVRERVATGNVWQELQSA